MGGIEGLYKDNGTEMHRKWNLFRVQGFRVHRA